MAEPYTVEMSRTAHRVFKKLDDPVKQRIKQETARIAGAPEASSLLKGLPLKVRSHHFILARVHWRIAYTVDEKAKKITVVLLGVRENFYERLKRLL